MYEREREEERDWERGTFECSTGRGQKRVPDVLKLYASAGYQTGVLETELESSTRPSEASL